VAWSRRSRCATSAMWPTRFSMRSRPIVADARRGWLDLQRDLGGDEVYFDTPLVPRAPAAAPRAATKAEPRAAAAEAATPLPAESAFRLKSYPAGSEPAWLKGAPAVPANGL